MHPAEPINQILARDVPVLDRMMSQRARSFVFPKGIVHQAAQARKAGINGTIGQLTDGRGGALPLAPVAKHLVDVNPKLGWLYAPVAGPPEIRHAWASRQQRKAGAQAVPTSLPFVTHGLAHAVSLVAGLVADPDLDVICPAPAWGNYTLVFALQGGGRILDFPFFDDQGGFNFSGLERRLSESSRKAVVILNFPNNPTGFVPTADEIEQIADLVAARPHPTIALCDDAYAGWVYDDNRTTVSPFWALAKRADPERMLPFKVDGATKELVFFSSRVGFLTHPLTGEAEAALESKLKCQVRGTVGCAPGPSLALLDQALKDPEFDVAFEAHRQMMATRATILRQALAEHGSPHLRPYPFHGAFFALVGVDGDVEALRQKLLADYDAGVIAFPEAGVLRVAFCSLHEEDIPELIKRIAAAVAS